LDYHHQRKQLFDTTVVVQGKLTEDCIEAVSYYCKQTNVIVSCWENDPIINRLTNENITLVINKLPKFGFHNYNNIGFQCYTTLQGLNLVESKFVIKVRGDELYGNLDPIIEAIHDNPRILTTNNVFFRPLSYLIYHPSDHVIAGLSDVITNMFLQTFAECVRIFNNNITDKVFGIPTKFFDQSTPIVPEQLLFMGYLRGKRIKPLFKLCDIRKIMQDNIQLIDVGNMGKIVMAYNAEKIRFTSKQSLFEHSPHIDYIGNL
jgi:hypothetical protein